MFENSKNFTFNDVSNKDMGVLLISSSNDKKILGYETTLNQDNYSKKAYLKSMYPSQVRAISFNLEITFVDIHENVIMPTREHKAKVLNWLLPKDDMFKAFVPEENGMEYYIKITSINEQSYTNGLHLFISCTMGTPYVFIPQNILSVNLSRLDNNRETIYFENKSDVNEKYSPIIKFEGSPYLNQNQTTQLKITNNSTGKSFVVKNIKPNEMLTINCGRKFINSNIDEEFKLKDMEGDFLELLYGYNQLTLEGNGDLSIITHFPMLML